MFAPLAHAGGFDEQLLAVSLVVLFLSGRSIRTELRKRRDRPHGRGRPS